MKQIHWHEGLFLQPHHLQQLQRGLLDQIGTERGLSSVYPYGVINGAASEDALKDYWVRYDRLRLVMRSGRRLNVPEDTDLAPRNLRPFFAQGEKRLRIYLAVPLWSADRPNVTSGPAGTDSQDKLLFRSTEEPCLDENTGRNPQPVVFRKTQARLLVNNEDDAGMEKLELLRVERDPRDPQAVPRQEGKFVSASVHLHAVPALWYLVRDLAHLMSARRESLAVQIKQMGLSWDAILPGQIEKILRLRTLNRACARLSVLLGPSAQIGDTALAGDGAGSGASKSIPLEAVGGVSPFIVYTELSEILGDLAALRLGHTDYAEEPYRHEDPFPCFELLCEKIQSFLVLPDDNKPEVVEFKQDQTWHTAELDQKHFDQPNRWFLGIRSDQDPDRLAQYVENGDRFRLLPTTMVKNKILVEGLKLRQATWVPPNLPGFKDLRYFQVDINNSVPDRFTKIKDERKMSISRIANEKGVTGVDLSRATFALYVIMPPKPANPASGS